MKQSLRDNQAHIGLSPYDLVFRGQKKTSEIRIRAIRFDAEHAQETELKSVKEISGLRDPGLKTWLQIEGLDDVSLMREVGSAFGAPDTILSDILNPSLRPQMEEFDNGLFITIKILEYNEKTHKAEIENLGLIFTGSDLISFQEKPGHLFDPVRERLQKHTRRIADRGIDYLCFSLLDIVVDNYIYVTSLLGEEVEAIGESLTSRPSKQIPEQINFYRQEMHTLRKHIKPAKELILSLNKTDSDLIQDSNRVHFKELLDNINEASELLDSYRDILYDQLNTYHSIMSSRLNDIIMVLTMFSVVFIPLTFIVGVYGTNFDYIPELRWQYGYPLMWLAMAVIALLMLWFFKRKKWF